MKVNPIKQARLDMNMSLIEMAIIANVTNAAVGQLEQGFYPEPLPSILIALGIPPGSERSHDITVDYKAYQLMKRRSNGPLFGIPRLTESPNFESGVHPLETWRRQSGLATYTFCSCYCIHMPVVNRFEKRITTCTEIPPGQITRALDDAGYELEEFTEACQVYKAALMNNSRISNNLPPVGVFK